MGRVWKVMVLLVLVAIGLCGCSRAPASRGGQADRLRVLESRCARLEQDYRTVAAARDQVRKQLDTLQAENAQLRKDVEGHKSEEQEKEELRRQVENLRQLLTRRTTERDEARNTLAQRTGERDSLQARYTRLTESMSRQMQQIQQMLTESTGPNGMQLPATTAGPTVDQP